MSEHPRLVQLTPSGIAVVVSLVITFMLFFGGVAVGGAYFVAWKAAQKAVAASVHADKNAVQECTALERLAHAGDGIKFQDVNAAHPSELALTRLFTDISAVVHDSGCDKIVNSR